MTDEEAIAAAKQTAEDLQLKNQRGQNYTKALRYLHKASTGPWRQEFIKCYTNMVLHLGTTTTSRRESANRALKVALNFTFTGDLLHVVDALKLLLKNYILDWEGLVSDAKNRLPHQLRLNLF